MGWLLATVVLVAAVLVRQYPRASFFLFLPAAFFALQTSQGAFFSHAYLDGMMALTWLYVICGIFAYFSQIPDRKWPINIIARWLRRQQDKQEHEVEED